MASTRFGHLDDFTLKNNQVGIGTSTPQEKMEVIGGTRSTDLRVAGIATLTSAGGFIEKHIEYVENQVKIDTGDSGTLSGEIVVGSGLTMTVGTAATTSQGTVDALKVYDMFQPPSGGTNQRPAGKLGALFYNFDLKTIEFFDGNSWRQVDNRSTSNRAVFAGSSGDDGEKFSEYVNISSLGNTTFFGTFANNFASGGRGYHGGCASETRGIIGGGWQPGAAYNNIDYFTVASAGTTIDFGNLQEQKGELDWCSSSTRGLTAGGEKVPFANTNTIDYIQISTIGNSLDFGDISTARRDGGMTSSPIHGFLMGGIASSQVDTIDLLTIASTGNGIDFGSLSGKNYPDSSVVSNGVAGFIMGGVGQGNITILTTDKFTFASGGNATVFGNLLIGRRNAAGASNLVRGLCAGGGNPSGHNVISYITMSSAGDAQDFGDLSVVRTSFAGLSDCHGGLGGF